MNRQLQTHEAWHPMPQPCASWGFQQLDYACMLISCCPGAGNPGGTGYSSTSCCCPPTQHHSPPGTAGPRGSASPR
jgi:hypothetical protein